MNKPNWLRNLLDGKKQGRWKRSRSDLAREAEYSRYHREGLGALAQSKITDAINAFGRAALFCPNHPIAHFNLGRSLFAAGKIEAAREAYSRALNLNPQMPEARRALLDLPPLPPEREDFPEDRPLHVQGMSSSFAILEVKKGGFGTVYVVVSKESRKLYALKTFQSKYLWREEDRERFMREALSWVQLDRHPNVVHAGGVVRIEGFPCLWLEYVPGNLADILSERCLPPAIATRFALQLCDGMFYLSQKLGIVHRDLKPSNLLVGVDMTLKVTDFGLARVFTEIRERTLGIEDLSSEVKTQFTRVAGTPYYMAPEQFDTGRQLDARTDIYAFGILFYQMLTQDLPPIGRASAHIGERASKCRVPEDLSEIILQCVETDVRRRPSDFRELRRSLEHAYKRLTRNAPPPPAEPLHMDAADWSDKGTALENLGAYEEALSCHQRAVSIDDRDPGVWMNYGAGLMKLGRFSEALECFKRGVEISPRDPGLWTNMAMSLASLQRLAEARACHERAVELQPQNETFWMNFGAFLAETGQHEEAMSCYERTLEINPRNANAWCNRAINLVRKARFKDGLLSCDNGLALEPRHHALWSTRAVALMNLDRFEEAIVACDRGIEIEPGDPNLWQNKGTNLAALNRLAEAEKCFDHAKALRGGVI